MAVLSRVFDPTEGPILVIEVRAHGARTGLEVPLLMDTVVAEFRYQKPSIRGLIGRDILCRGEFRMGADHYFSFGVPDLSQE